MCRRHALQFFVDGAQEYLSPKSIDRLPGLILFMQPVEHRDVVEIGAAPIFGANRQHGTADSNLRFQRKEPKLRKGFGEMKRGRQQSSLHYGGSATWFNPIELLVKL